MLNQVAAAAAAVTDARNQTDQATSEIKLPELFQLVVECENEDQQRQLYERLSADGYKCRVLTL
jgi:hypothetical protein